MAQVTELHELLPAERAGHQPRDVAPVRESNRALRADAGLREAYAACAPIVWIVDPLHEAAVLQPCDQSRHAGLAQQHIIEELRYPKPVGCVRERVEHSVFARAELAPDLGVGELAGERPLGAEERLPG